MRKTIENHTFEVENLKKVDNFRFLAFPVSDTGQYKFFVA